MVDALWGVPVWGICGVGVMQRGSHRVGGLQFKRVNVMCEEVVVRGSCSVCELLFVAVAV